MLKQSFLLISIVFISLSNAHAQDEVVMEINGNKVTKEYYINDYGNQIMNFIKSVFFRVQEIRYKKVDISL